MTRLLVYCDSANCSHSSTLSIAGMDDDVAIRPLGLNMRCKVCGHLGADVRPDYPPAAGSRLDYFKGS